jgi:hypothetical protein
MGPSRLGVHDGAGGRLRFELIKVESRKEPHHRDGKVQLAESGLVSIGDISILFQAQCTQV